MNKIFSGITSIFAVPLTRLVKTSKIVKRKFKLDTFLGGLVIGALFTLIINVMTIRIGEDVSKQRALEAMESEIALNNLSANGVVATDNTLIKSKYMPSVFHDYYVYDENVYNNPLTLQYLEQINPKILAEINSYYLVYVKNTNQLDTDINKLSTSLNQICYPSITSSKAISIDANTQDFCIKTYAAYLNIERNSAIQISNTGFSLTSVFHPTRDRLNNPLLSLIMGKEALPILSLPHKALTKSK